MYFLILTASALENLDDDHAPAAARARMGERLGFSLTSADGIAGLDACCLYVEQLTRPRDVVGASAIGEEAIVTDAMEAARQASGEETAGRRGTSVPPSLPNYGDLRSAVGRVP